MNTEDAIKIAQGLNDELPGVGEVLCMAADEGRPMPSLADFDLARIKRAWPRLPDRERRGVSAWAGCTSHHS